MGKLQVFSLEDVRQFGNTVDGPVKFNTTSELQFRLDGNKIFSNASSGLNIQVASGVTLKLNNAYDLPGFPSLVRNSSDSPCEPEPSIFSTSSSSLANGCRVKYASAPIRPSSSASVMISIRGFRFVPSVLIMRAISMIMAVPTTSSPAPGDAATES